MQEFLRIALRADKNFVEGGAVYIMRGKEGLEDSDERANPEVVDLRRLELFR